MPESMTPLIILGVVGALFILLLSLLTNNYCCPITRFHGSLRLMEKY